MIVKQHSVNVTTLTKALETVIAISNITIKTIKPFITQCHVVHNHINPLDKQLEEKNTTEASLQKTSHRLSGYTLYITIHQPSFPGCPKQGQSKLRQTQTTSQSEILNSNWESPFLPPS